MPYPDLPPDIEETLKKARRLEWWTIFFMSTIILAMGLVLGSSQAMRTAWIEDMLSLLPPILFLVSGHFERRAPTEGFPFGFQRTSSLAFFGSAMALTAMGGFLLYEAIVALVRAQHPTIGSVSLAGREIWLGWLMLAALIYSVIPPVILGRMKRPLARKIADKVLYTDADMNAADWRTGAAGIAGVIGIGFGLWWADAVAAGLISFSILKDGLSNLRTSVVELLDGAPREIGGNAISDEARGVARALGARWPGANILMRETGRYMRAVVSSQDEPSDEERAQATLGGKYWRLIEVSRTAEPDDDPQRSGRASRGTCGTPSERSAETGD